MGGSGEEPVGAAAQLLLPAGELLHALSQPAHLETPVHGTQKLIRGKVAGYPLEYDVSRLPGRASGPGCPANRNGHSLRIEALHFTRVKLVLPAGLEAH